MHFFLHCFRDLAFLMQFVWLILHFFLSALRAHSASGEGDGGGGEGDSGEAGADGGAPQSPQVFAHLARLSGV